MKSKDNKFKPVSSRIKISQAESEILDFWQKEDIFKKSLDSRPEDDRYVFYDGPPFVTGVPHYGSLLSSIVKDVVPRYWTMKGKRVRRVWGWDCHGLPIENKVEDQLKLKNKTDIEKIGVKKFVSECKSYVSQTSPEWKWYVDHVGRWVDFENAYRTMDLDYMETVMWVFKQIYEKGLIYQGKRVSLYCPRCSTPVSNFEIAMDQSYKSITDPSTVYKYQLKDQENTYLLAWSTTPWNKLATPALAINPKLEYLKVKQNDDYYILAKETQEMLEDDFQVVDQFSGKELEGLSFVPHYDFYNTAKDPKAFKVYGADFVTADEGTGVVTIAAYGEEDFELMTEKGIPLVEHVDEQGFVKPEVTPWAGEYYLKVDPKVNQDLKKRGLVYKETPHTHNVAVCWRCKTRLIYAPQDAWFIKVSQLKDQMLKTNQQINWIPDHLKKGRFAKGIKNAPDWCISRSRYWGSPMPVWECKCGQRYVPGSIKELESMSGQKITDLHRPEIDKVTIKCGQCQDRAKRIPDVLDCWVESGSMPYAERHYPFENKQVLENNFPADFVAEYIAQTRAWFYVMHVISNALFKKPPFKNVVATGVIMGTDGRKMSKSYGNYPDPRKTIEKYGGDSLRLYLLGSQLMSGQDINIDQREMENAVKTIILPLWNIYRYLVINCNRAGYYPVSKPADENALDKWVSLKLRDFVNRVEDHLQNYQINLAVRLFQPFIDDVSTWYIRRSRKRFVSGDQAALNTLYHVLINLVKTMAPFAPFITEKIYQNLKKDTNLQSVHLCEFPQLKKLEDHEKKSLKMMSLVREACSLGNNQRKELGIKLRQPLAQATVYLPKNQELSNDLARIIKQEFNVKNLEISSTQNQETKVKFDTQITPELKAEGKARDIVRKIQNQRRKQSFKLGQPVVVVLPDWPESFTDYIKSQAQVAKLKKGESFAVSPFKK